MAANDTKVLTAAFFRQDTVRVARALLGQKLVRQLDQQRLVGIICETEAYLGGNDSASHAFKGPTPRNAVMFGPPARAYVYLVYGMHHMLNIVTEAQGRPRAVLIRGVVPWRGEALMRQHRGGRRGGLTDGPGKLCQALAIDRSLNGWDLTRRAQLWLERHLAITADQIQRGPRIGIPYARPQDRRAPWRFWLRPGMVRQVAARQARTFMVEENKVVEGG